MLIGQSRWRSDTRAIDTAIVLDRACRAHLVRRHRLLFDSRFAAALGAPSSDVVTLYLVLEGFFSVDGGPRHDAPSIWALPDDELDEVTPASRTFRSWGAPTTVMTLRLRADAVHGAIGLANGPRPLPEPVAVALRAFAAGEGAPAKAEAFRAIIDGLIASGHVAASVARELVSEEPAHLERVWTALATVYERQDTAAYVDLIAALAGVSLRQAQRDLRELSLRAGFSSFGATLRVMRLRRAVSFLSAVELSVAEVAKIVGYGSVDAMGRAFRDARLPTPSVVRQHVAYPLDEG